MADSAFPMLDGPPIPMETAEVAYQAYSAIYGVGQSLETIGKRGGFGWGEVALIFRELRRKNPELWRKLRQPTQGASDDQ